MITGISENTVLEWITGAHTSEYKLARVLWLNPSEDVVVIFDLNNKKAVPEFMSHQVLLDGLESGEIHKKTFIVAKNQLVDGEISETYRRRRDKAWELIRDLVSHVNEPAIYDERQRWKMIQGTVQRTNTTHRQIYIQLRRYWWGGKTVNSLLPNYDNCGKGTTRSYSKKTGRRSVRSRSNPELRGIPVTEEVESIFRKSVKLWYHSRDRLPFTIVYENMIETFFNVGYEEINGKMVPQLTLPEQRPTLRQFRYWYSQNRDQETELRARFGSRRYNLSYREVTGNTNQESFGPGSVFQIDATIADIYLVHRLNREWLIGRPVIYFVVDHFSRLIVGMYVGLEGPSWLGAMMALENAGSDKVQYCARHGISIESSEWPAHHMPDVLTSDRGEFEGTRPTNLIKTLRVDVQTLPPYRPDWKPVIERQFRLRNDNNILWTPGAVRERILERGERDYRLDATLDLEQFETLLIHEILHYNNYHAISTYQRTPIMIREDVAPIPLHLWNWGRTRGFSAV